MLIGAAYIRVSTDDQMESSPDSQLKKIQEYAKSNEIQLPKEYIFMEEEGRSGRNVKRPQFQRMIALAKTTPKPFDMILLWKFSRFARNREDSVVYKSMLRKQCGINVISVSEPIGEERISILMEAIIEAMDEYYSINLASEVLRGMTEKAQRGGLVGSPPYGYQVEDGCLITDSVRAPIVRNIFQQFIAGDSYTMIAENLNSQKILTRHGGFWDNRLIEYILCNPTYAGKIRWSPNGALGRDFDREGVIISQGKHIPLIPLEVFERAQVRVNTIRCNHRPYQRGK